MESQKDDYYDKKMKEHTELVGCMAYLVFGLLIVALILTLKEWLVR